MNYFSYWIKTTNSKSITPKNENFETVFLCVFKGDNQQKKGIQDDGPKKENNRDIYFPKQG